jgi:hypothetical protein
MLLRSVASWGGGGGGRGHQDFESLCQSAALHKGNLFNDGHTTVVVFSLQLDVAG